MTGSSDASFLPVFDVCARGADPTGATDSTQAVAATVAAINALAPGSACGFPYGTYELSQGPVRLTAPVRLVGIGAGGGWPNAGSRLFSTGTDAMFATSEAGFNGLSVEGISFESRGGGDIFAVGALFRSGFRDCYFTLSAEAGCAFRTSGAITFNNSQFRDCYFISRAPVRSDSMINLQTTTGGGLANLTWDGCMFQNTGKDATQYLVQIACTGQNNGHYQNCFRNCNFRFAFGGAVKSISGLNLSVEQCSTWDIFAGQGAEVAASTYYVGQSSAGKPSQGSRFVGITRNLDGPDGTSTWDVEIEETTQQTLIESCSVKNSGAVTTNHFYVNANSCADLTLMANQWPGPANGQSSTVVTNPSPRQFAFPPTF
jgi:hypothetical protein